MNNNNDSLLLLSLQSALKAGDAVMKFYRNKNLAVKRKIDFSPVTKADHASHDVLIKELETTGLPVISEEGIQVRYAERMHWKAFWLIDPLDGTKEFIRQNDEFTINVALIENNTPALGVVYAPATGDLYFGSSSRGSYRMNTPVAENFSFHDIKQVIRLSTKLPPKIHPHPFTVVASRSHWNYDTNRYISLLKREHSGVEVISRGSSLKFCLVAEGKADIYPRLSPTMEWDTAAGQAVAIYAGCSVNRYDTGMDLTYNKKNLRNPWFIVKRK